MPLKFLSSQKKGGKILVNNGFMYHFHSEGVNKYIWRCILYKGMCRGICHTTTMTRNGEIIKETEHTHAGNIAKVEARIIRNNIRKNVQRSREPTSLIVSTAVAEASTSAVGQLPNMASLQRSARRLRAARNPIPPMPSSSNDSVLPESYQITCKGKKFLMYDSATDHRILIFTTTENLEVLRRCDTWFADGTFKTVPNIFDQLYTIHGLVNGKVLSLVYVLCCDRRRRTYSIVLEELKKLEPRLSPVRIIVDFEMAFITAIERVFPVVEIKGCLFHFAQCVWRKVQELGLQQSYNTDGEFALNVRMLIALAFVPEQQVSTAFEELAGSAFYVENLDALKPLLDYFAPTWVGVFRRNKRRRGPTFEIGVWNHYQSMIDDTAQTNNAVEGWHNAFNAKAQASHLSTWKFIDLLKSEQGVVEMTIEQGNAGAVAAPRKRKYRDLDERIKNVVASFDETNIVGYLRGIAQNLLL